jgi:hypothetical protein
MQFLTEIHSNKDNDTHPADSIVDGGRINENISM